VPRELEEKFQRWSNPPSETEARKLANAQSMVNDAIRDYEPLRSHEISIIPQGSYRNNTNVRQESDVDICVCSVDTFYSDFQFADYSKSEAGLRDVSYSSAQLKNDVQAALERKFGKLGVSRRNKAFDIHENTYRVDADVVAAFAYRRYLKRTYNPLLGMNVTDFINPPGTKFFCDDGTPIINWPEQQYANEVQKNVRTGRRFKSIVRVVKSLKYEMAEAAIAGDESISPFLIECMAYNTPDNIYGDESFVDNVRDWTIWCYGATKSDADSLNLLESNELKYLFRPGQPWTRQQANDFTLAVWNFCGFS